VSEHLAFPPAREARGTVRVPASKSATNRALLLAAIGEQPVEILGPLRSEDTSAIAACLAAMGGSIERTAGGVRVHGPLGLDPARRVALDARDSGTAGRLLAAVAAAVPGHFLLTGSERLRERPIANLVDALRGAGARVAYAGADGFLPLEIEGATLEAGASVRVDAALSGQFLSALLIAGAAVRGGGGMSAAASGRVASEPYVRLTVAMLREFGHTVEESGGVYRVARGRTALATYALRGDWSSAVPLLAAAAIAGGEVRVEGVAWPAEDVDADAAAAGVLESMGVAIGAAPGGVSARASRGALRAVDVDAADFPDAVPALAACAAFAEGESRFTGVAHLRVKESDRIDALAAVLRGAGVESRGEADALVVRGAAPGSEGALRRLPTRNDHRIAMAAGLLALATPGVLIENPGCVAKSYPAFWRALDSLAVRR
jgi:3-phosphoshikimate 1-carboxyvinyltransferase